MFVGWLVDGKGHTGPRGADQPKKKGDQEESEQARTDDAAVCPTTKLQLPTCSIWTYPNTSSNTRIQHAYHVIALHDSALVPVLCRTAQQAIRAHPTRRYSISGSQVTTVHHPITSSIKRDYSDSGPRPGPDESDDKGQVVNTGPGGEVGRSGQSTTVA